MITIDGSQGEGGGQILRTALGLSLVTGKNFTINNIRAGRRKPGLLNQHLTGVKAALQISGGKAEGAELGSQKLVFSPGNIKGGSYTFSVGTAGSTMLVFQAVLPGLLVADEPTVLTLEGGTHNPFAPPFTFLEKSFLPLLEKMGVKVTMELQRCGFYPAGGGKVIITVHPVRELKKIDLTERGEIKHIGTSALVTSKLPLHIARREVEVLQKKLHLDQSACTCLQVDSNGPGNVVLVSVESDHLTAVFTGFGEKKVRAEKVADLVAEKVKRYLKNLAPVGYYLADQLLIPFSLAGGGKFKTSTPTEHTMTNIKTIKQFLDIEITCKDLGGEIYEIQVLSNE